MKDILLLILLLIQISCTNKTETLFYINQPSGETNDFLYMAESTNIEYIPILQLLPYLDHQEILAAELFHYKDFGTIYKNNKFQVKVIFKEGSGEGRDYQFVLRTFNFKNNIIDSYTLAAWKESEDLYCFGSINSELSIKKTCNYGDSYEFVQISKFGKFILNEQDTP